MWVTVEQDLRSPITQSNRSFGPPPSPAASPAHCGQQSPKALKPSSQPLAQESLYSRSQAGVRPTHTGQGVRVPRRPPPPPPSPQAPGGADRGSGPQVWARPTPAASPARCPLSPLGRWDGRTRQPWSHAARTAHRNSGTTCRGRPGCAKVRQSL